MSQTYTFQAETQQLLDILIHSLYTEREIFLRELISNASDALNRVQFEMLTNDDVLSADAELAIRIRVDEEAKTITISDTGIGMTQEEVIENLGTIARSGAKNFIQALKDAPNNQTAQDIIGQFGVGFYSVFMVADKVRVVTRSAQKDASAVVWEATGGTEYTLDEGEREDRGTDIIIYLNEEAQEFAQENTLRNIIKRHSNYVAFPIYLGEPKSTSDEDGEDSAEEQTPINSQQAIWRKSPSEVEDDEYNSFYQMMTFDFQSPLHRLHLRADVPMQFYALLYYPASSEPNMFSLRKEAGLQLYARKILIEDYNRELLPEYLQFVQGVVDSEDLPLNVSRESVKADRIMAKLKSTITKRVLGDLKKLASNDKEQYLQIHEQFGRFLKQGAVIEAGDRDDLLELIFFNSSHDDNPNSWHRLADYVERMVDGQEEIYYLIADDFHTARRSPHLDAFRQRGIEVLYFSDPIDAMLPNGLTEYRDFKLRAIDDADIDLKDVGETPEDEADQPEALETDLWQQLEDRVKAVLGGRIKGLRQSKTLVGSAARLVSEDGAAHRHMFRINRLLDREYELPVKTLELNPRHPLLHNVSGMLANDGNNPMIDVIIEQIFETALLQEGIHPDPASMAERLTMLMQAATGTPSDQLGWQASPPDAVAHDHAHDHDHADDAPSVIEGSAEDVAEDAAEDVKDS
jgi:molecular chaperone HtpG